MYHLQKHKAGKQWFVFEGSWHDIVGVDMFPSLKVKFRFPRKVFEVPFWKTQPWTFDLGLSKGKTTNSSRFPNQICHLGVCSILWCINMSMYTIFNFDHPKWVYAINLCSKETMCSWSWCLVKKHHFFRLTPLVLCFWWQVTPLAGYQLLAPTPAPGLALPQAPGKIQHMSTWSPTFVYPT